jgi:hypothetical protein
MHKVAVDIIEDRRQSRRLHDEVRVLTCSELHRHSSQRPRYRLGIIRNVVGHEDITVDLLCVLVQVTLKVGVADWL